MRHVTEPQGSGADVVRLMWPAADPILRDAPRAVNQFAFQINSALVGEPDSVVLLFGHSAPPVLVGDPEDQRRQLETLRGPDGVFEVQVSPVARVEMTVGRARELLAGLLQLIQAWEQQVEGGGTT